jgi:hypothetical protein
LNSLEPPASGRDLNVDIALMVRLGRHKETVRYWYKLLGDHDFAIQGILNHEALGLKRLVFELKFGEMYSGYVKPMMDAMNELCFVVSYAKGLPEDTYIVNSSVPDELVGDYLALVNSLEEQGVFKIINYYLLDWVRNVPMRAELYDFSNGRWSFDYPSVMKQDAPASERPMPAKVKFDKIDLLIAKELQIDAKRELQEIQRAIKESEGVDINYKTLCWHLKEHVEGHGLLKGYKVNWMGTRWDPVADRAKHRSHAYVLMTILVKGPNPEQRKRLMWIMDRVPTVWSEGMGDDFFAEVALPRLEGVHHLPHRRSEGGRGVHLLIQAL